MLRNIYSEKIKQYKLDKLVEIMVWTYIKGKIEYNFNYKIYINFKFYFS